MRARLGILAALVLLGSAPVSAQDTTVRAVVDESTVSLQEHVLYSVHIDGAPLSEVETPAPPEATGLVVVQRTPSSRRTMSIDNGVIRQSITFQWTFQPLREGTASIEAVDVTIADRTYSTEAIQVEVVPRSQRPNQGAAGQRTPFVVPSRPQAEDRAIEARDLFIRAVPSTGSARQNEQVTIEYQLYFRDGIQLRHSRLAGSWDAEGFWREEFNVDARPVPRSVVENGVLYHTIVLKRVAVFPTRSGTLTIDPLEIETEAYAPSGSSDLFQRYFTRSQFETVELASEPVDLDVRPLPANAPASFAGAVGTYDVGIQTDRASLQVGEPMEVLVTVRGSGNIATLDAPHFDPPGIFERYQPEIESTIDRDGVRIRGTKTFRYLLVPRSSGTFEMPPVTLTYFDTSREQYTSAEASLSPITVTGTPVPLERGTNAKGLPVGDIVPIMTAVDAWHTTSSTPLHRQPWAYAALALPSLALLLFFGYQRRADLFAGDPRFARSRMAHPLARKHLNEAQLLLSAGRPQAFYEEIDRAVTGFVGNRLNLPETGLTRSQLDARLMGFGVGEEDRRLLRRLLEECDQARYAPVLPNRAAMESARERAAHLIVAVDQAAEKHGSDLFATSP